MTDTYLCEPADVEWQGDIPYSKRYKDIYWHRAGALQEKRHVFIEPFMRQVEAIRRNQQVTVC